MKKILFILFLLVSFVSYGQVYQLMPQYGYQTNRMNFDSTLQIPTTCGVPTLKTTYNVKRAAIAFDSCNNRYYYYNPKTTSWAFLGSTSGKVDSVTKASSTYVDTFKYWINGTATIYATIDKPDGLISGGDVTQNTQTNFTIKSAIYRIGGVRYTTRDTTISIAALPDTPRIDLFVIDTSGKTKYLQGTESQSAAPPNYDREKAIALSFVFVYNDSSFVSVPPTLSYWAIFPKSQYPANSLQNTNGSDIVLTNGLWLPNVLEGQFDSTNYKPIATDADGNVVRMNNWISGGGSIPSLQQVTDVNDTTTNNLFANSIYIKDEQTFPDPAEPFYTRIKANDNTLFVYSDSAYGFIQPLFSVSDFAVGLRQGNFSIGLIYPYPLTTNLDLHLPETSGTLALKEQTIDSLKRSSDSVYAQKNGQWIFQYKDSIGGGSGFVPYTGATQDVDLGTNKISSQSVYVTGTNGNGHLHLKHQASDATATGQSTSLFADSNGDIKWKNDGNYYTTLKTSGNTADAVYTFPSATTNLIGATDTSVFQRKQIAAYSIMANQTNAPANASPVYFKDTSGTYNGTITWTGTTPPSNLSISKYNWTRIGKQVTLFIAVYYTTAGTSLTQVNFDLPADAPTPDVSYFTTLSASNLLYQGFGAMGTSANILQNNTITNLRRNAANTGYEFQLSGASQGYRRFQITITYMAQ